MNHSDSSLVAGELSKPQGIAELEPIPWAAPLTLAMQAMKRAERLLVDGRFDEALIELRNGEDNARFCRLVIEAKRS